MGFIRLHLLLASALTSAHACTCPADYPECDASDRWCYDAAGDYCLAGFGCETSACGGSTGADCTVDYGHEIERLDSLVSELRKRNVTGKTALDL